DPPLIKDGYFLVTTEVEQALEAKCGRAWHLRFPDWDRDQDGRYWLALKHDRPGPLPRDDREMTALQQQASASSSQPQTQASPQPQSPKQSPPMSPTHCPTSQPRLQSGPRS